MQEEKFSPEQGFETIASVIREAKAQFEEDGIIYVGWGLLIAIASFTQYYLLNNGHAEVSYYPYLLMPLGSIASGIYATRREKKAKRTHLSKIVASTWVSLGISILLFGFLLGSTLGTSLVPIILIFISIGLMVSGATISSKMLLISGVAMNLIGFYAFTWEGGEQPLLMEIASVICVLIPGIILMRSHKRNNV